MHRRVHAADHDGLAIIDAYLGVDLVLADRRHVIKGIEVVGLVLGHLDRHDHPVVRGNLRGHLKRQRRLAEGHGRGTAAAGFLVRHFGALEDPRGFLVGGNHLGLGDDFAVAGLFHGAEFQIEQYVIAHQANPDASRRPIDTEVDKSLGAAKAQALAHLHSPTPAHPKTLLEIDIGLDDACFDHHLTNRHVQFADQPAQLFQALRRLAGDQGVGALVDTQRAVAGAPGLMGHQGMEKLGNISGLGVVNRDQLAPCRH
ncbi:hypothetical protein D3C78_490690 [compost metagenome]